MQLFNHFSFCLLMLFIAGCVDTDVSDLNQYIQQVKSKPKGIIKPLPEIKIIDPFLFNPDGLRDPFRPVERFEEVDNIEEASLSTGIRPDKSRRKEELEAYSLDTLRMVGTLTLNKGLWALIQANDGTIHRVKKGNHMGLNFGKINRISDDRVELMEIVPDKPGLWKQQQASIALAE